MILSTSWVPTHALIAVALIWVDGIECLSRYERGLQEPLLVRVHLGPCLAVGCAELIYLRGVACACLAFASI